MKRLSASLFVFVLALVSSVAVQAQTAESIWIQSGAQTFKSNETVIVTVDAVSSTPIQGFTAQIRYDPTCLQPVSGTSPVAGMNGLALPQVAGLADVSFASTTPVVANGVLAELRFTSLKGCQTSLSLESAALVVRNDAGMAAPISGVSINQNPVMLTIDGTIGNPQPEEPGASVLPLAPATAPETAVNWRMIGSLTLAVVLVASVIGLFAILKPSER